MNILTRAASFLILTAGFSAQVFAGSFEGLSGLWSGPATLAFSSGAIENLKCRTTFIATGESSIKVTVRCAGSGAGIEAVAQVTDTDGKLSGTWVEKVYESNGKLTGTSEVNTLSIKISGGFDASLSIVTTGSERQILLSPASGPVKSLSVKLVQSQ